MMAGDATQQTWIDCLQGDDRRVARVFVPETDILRILTPVVENGVARFAVFDGLPPGYTVRFMKRVRGHPTWLLIIHHPSLPLVPHGVSSVPQMYPGIRFIEERTGPRQ